jgi:hypothetical protein
MYMYALQELKLAIFRGILSHIIYPAIDRRLREGGITAKTWVSNRNFLRYVRLCIFKFEMQSNRDGIRRRRRKNILPGWDRKYQSVGWLRIFLLFFSITTLITTQAKSIFEFERRTFRINENEDRQPSGEEIP